MGLVRVRNESLLLRAARPFTPKQIQIMCTIGLTATVHIDEITDSVDDYKEKEVLFRILENFDRNNVAAAIRNYFGLLNDQGEGLPDFVDAEKL